MQTPMLLIYCVIKNAATYLFTPIKYGVSQLMRECEKKMLGLT